MFASCPVWKHHVSAGTLRPPTRFHAGPRRACCGGDVRQDRGLEHAAVGIVVRRWDGLAVRIHPSPQSTLLRTRLLPSPPAAHGQGSKAIDNVEFRKPRENRGFLTTGFLVGIGLEDALLDASNKCCLSFESSLLYQPVAGSQRVLGVTPRSATVSGVFGRASETRDWRLRAVCGQFGDLSRFVSGSLRCWSHYLRPSIAKDGQTSAD
jgi:hypothetical protein